MLSSRLQQQQTKILATHQRGSAQGEAARAIKGLGSSWQLVFKLVACRSAIIIWSARNLKIIAGIRAGLFLMLAWRHWWAC